MKALMVGGGPESGASCMRADQLGRAIGARVHVDPWHDPNPTELEWCDFVVIVKRLKKRWNRWIARVLHIRKPIVWDALDFWKQPEENACTERELRKSFARRKGELGAKLVIGATQKMASDCGAIYLPHHYRIGTAPRDVRRDVKLVGYEGSSRYLDIWMDPLTAECDRRGWQFVVNPTSLAEMDIVVALRGGPHDGWACRAWKSGVKYGNSIAVARPIITQPTAAFAEMKPPGSAIESVSELTAAFDYWADYDTRLVAAQRASELAPQYHIDKIAERYRQILRQHMGR